MSALKRLVHEVHRRSLWQVLVIYLAGSWLALQVAGAVTESAGLPDWTPGMALVILVILLPVVLGTAFVQEGMPGSKEAAADAGPATTEAGPIAEQSPDGLHHRVFRWRTVLFGALGAFTLLGLSIFAYFVMWSSGIGPVGNLQAQGVIEAGASVLLAEFENRTDDPEMGTVLSVALRTDLEQSEAISVVGRSQVEEGLRRMGRGADEALTPDLARELALREGISAIIEGEVGALGSSFVLTVRIVATDESQVLASFRETATREEDLPGALERLSRAVRERVGESLRSINRTPALAQVTTGSLEALRAYTKGVELYGVGEIARGIGLVEQAVALDTAFAMGHRQLAVWYYNGGRTADMKEASRRAVRFSERLPRLERDLSRAWYQAHVEGDADAAIRTYRDILDYRTSGTAANNNLAYLLMRRGEYAQAREVLEVSDAAGTLGRMGYQNLVRAQMASGDVDAARRTLGRAVDVGGLPPSTQFGWWAELAARTGGVEEAHAWADSIAQGGDHDLADYRRWAADFRVGRLNEARRHMSERMERSARSDRPGSAVGDRSILAVTVLQADTAGAIALLQTALKDAEAAPLDRVDLATLGWAHWRAGMQEGVGRARALAEAGKGEGNGGGRGELLPEGQLVYLRFLDAVAKGLDDKAALDAAERSCAVCQPQERAEMSFAAGRLDEAAAHYEEMLRTPGYEIWGDLWAPLFHERVAAIYEELGDKAKAAEHYRAFAELWKDADPELQPRVRKAREKAEALGRN